MLSTAQLVRFGCRVSTTGTDGYLQPMEKTPNRLTAVRSDWEFLPEAALVDLLRWNVVATGPGQISRLCSAT